MHHFCLQRGSQEWKQHMELINNQIKEASLMQSPKDRTMEVATGQEESKGLGKHRASARNSKHPNSLYQKAPNFKKIKTSSRERIQILFSFAEAVHQCLTLFEKRRRGRINASLEQLRKLLQQLLPDQQNGKAFSCLEQAEILEKTVQHLHRLKEQDAVAAPVSQDNQDFVSGYCHCVDAICTFLNSAGSTLAQEMKYQILHHLGEISGPRSTTAIAPKVWQLVKADSLTSHQPSFLWASAPLHSPLMPAESPLDSDSHGLRAVSRLQFSASTALPQLQKPWTKPALLATTTHVWRPW